MTLELETLLREPLEAAKRFGIDPPISRRRAWPLRDGGWLALLAGPTLHPRTTWAVLRPDRAWPPRVRRLLESGAARQLLGQRIAAWPLDAEPVLADRDAWLSPGDLPGARGPGRVVSYKPLRRIVTRFTNGRGEPLYYAKHLRSRGARRGADHHRLVAAWFGAAPHLRLPELLTVEGASGRMVWKAATGVAPRSLQAQADLLRAFATAGGCLAFLHRCPARLVDQRSRDDELRTLDGWLGVLRAVADPPRSAVEVLSALRSSSPSLGTSRLVVSHGDFHEGQLLCDGSSATLLDLDTLTLGEPELDLGNFLAHLDLLALERPAVAVLDLEARVLDVYSRSRGPLAHPARLAWYRAAATLRIACVHAPRPQTGHLVPKLVDWARQLTAQLWTRAEENVS